MTKKIEKTYFMVGLVDKVMDKSNTTLTRFFKVFEFTKGRVYFELIDESNLELYKQPILIKDVEVNMIHDNPEATLKHLETYIPQVKIAKDAELLMESLEKEIKEICEKYNLSREVEAPKEKTK